MGNKKNRTSNKKSNNINNKENTDGNGTFFVIPIILLCFIYAFIISVMDGAYANIPMVFGNNEPIDKSLAVDTGDYYYQSFSLVEDNRLYSIADGVEYFYEKTGIRTFVCAVNGIDGNTDVSEEVAWDFCREIYETEFDDEAHMVFLFIYDENALDEYTLYFYCGEEAAKLIGDFEKKVLSTTVRHQFNLVYDHADLFGETLKFSADRIMDGTTSIFTYLGEHLRATVLVLSTVVVAVPSVVIFMKLKKRY